MREGGGGKGDGKPQQPEEGRGGTAARARAARQARPACDENTRDEKPTLMEEVLRRENLLRAYRRVVHNAGAPGVDGMTVEALGVYCREHWARIREELREGTYMPQPIRRVEIPKPEGKGTRVLGIPTVLDRLIQQALLQVLSPIFDPTFSGASYGFRPGRSTHDAVRRSRAHVATGYEWVVDLDLEKFFDRVNHDVLMARVARQVKDKRVLRLIRRYLQAGMMEEGLMSPRREGTPQGGPLSPVLSNVLLDELDKELERRGHRFVRYADDCNVYVKSAAAGERVMASLERFLWGRLRLRINRDKSAVARPWERRFLGYSFTAQSNRRLKVAPQSVRRLKSKLRPLLRVGRGQSLATTIVRLNRVLRGWVAYYRWAEATTIFRELDAWIRRKLRCVVWRQWKTPRTRLKRLCRLGINLASARTAAYNGRGPWFNSKAQQMQYALPNASLRQQGLVSLFDEHQRLARLV